MAEVPPPKPDSLGLPSSIQNAIETIGRFEHLEIGAFQPSFSVDSRPGDQVLCAHCGKYNDPSRNLCWACFRYVGKMAKQNSPLDRPQDFEFVLDGKTYRYNDPQTPSDILTLMDQIRKEGYSKQLLIEWRNWRATRNRTSLPLDKGTHVVKEGDLVIIHIDGKRYTSDDLDLIPEIQTLMNYIKANDVTPALMDQLRLYGTKVKYRPSTTGDPTDGDIDFWKQMNSRGYEALLQVEATKSAAVERLNREGRSNHLLDIIALSLGVLLIIGYMVLTSEGGLTRGTLFTIRGCLIGFVICYLWSRRSNMVDPNIPNWRFAHYYASPKISALALTLICLIGAVSLMGLARSTQKQVKQWKTTLPIYDKSTYSAGFPAISGISGMIFETKDDPSTIARYFKDNSPINGWIFIKAEGSDDMKVIYLEKEGLPKLQIYANLEFKYTKKESTIMYIFERKKT